MSWTTKIVGLGIAAIGGVIVLRYLPVESRHRMTLAVGNWMSKRVVDHMGRMMASLPEGAPPKLVASILPKLQMQNEQIIAMLREQNELLRRQQRISA
jgi:hypothetical protein